MNRTLELTVLAACLVFLALLRRSGARQVRGWRAVLLLCLGVLAASHFTAPGVSGYISFAALATLYLAPVVLAYRSRGHIQRQDLDAALRCARLAALLHPCGSLRYRVRVARAMVEASGGHWGRADALLAADGSGDPEDAQTARLSLWRMAGRWAELSEWAHSLSAAEAASPGLGYAGLYLRALAESGEVSAALLAYPRLTPALVEAGQLTEASAVLFAFGGEVEAYEAIVERHPGLFGRDAVTFWRATALAAAGRPEEAGQLLRPLAELKRPTLSAAVSWRLEHLPSSASQTLSPEAAQVLASLKLECEQEDLYGEHDIGLAPVSSLLITANALIFTLPGVVASGAFQPRLYQWGVLSPLACLYGEWYRVFSYQFLHQGLLHIGMNLMGLWYLAPFVERHLGRLRFLLLYLASGALAGLCIVYATAQGWMPVRVYLGASGSIMGLVGATAAILWRGWRRDRAPLAKARLTGVAVVVVLQVVFDHLMPRVSGEAHLLGLTWGLILGVLLLHTLPERNAD